MTPEKTVDDYNRSTVLTWLWSFVFGPIYFLWHGFYGKAFLVFMLNLILVGFILAPFIAYGAWRERARERFDKERLIAAMEKSRDK